MNASEITHFVLSGMLNLSDILITPACISQGMDAMISLVYKRHIHRVFL